MGTIAIVPAPEAGHINPTLRLRRELTALGHDVRYITTPGHEDHFVERGLPLTLAKEERRPGTSIGYALDFAPDVLLVDSIMPDVAIWAWGQGLKVLTMSILLPRGYDPTIPPLTTDLLPATGPEAAEAIRAAWEQEHQRNTVQRQERSQMLMQLARSVDFPLEWLDERAAMATTTRLSELVLAPAEIDFPRSTSPGIVYCGPCVDLSRPEIPLDVDALVGSRPVIYCSFGTQLHRYKDVGARWQLIMDTARRMTDLCFVIASGIEYTGPVADNVIVLRQAPQLAILRRSSLMISHGGINATVESMCLGVPLVVLPFDMDQPGNAARVVYHGLGRSHRWGDLNSDALETLIRDVLGDHGTSERVDVVSRRFKSLLAEPTAARAFEECLAGVVTR